MKKSLCLVLAVVLLLGLTACGAAPTGSGHAAPASTPATDEAYYVPPAPEPGWPEEGWAGEGDDWHTVPASPGEEYDDSPETPFKDAKTSPLSTFSADVDTASYSNMRRQLRSGMQPQGVRVEELVNYFDYDYPRPGTNAEHPFTVSTELGVCPWNEDHLLAMIGVQGAELEDRDEIASNIVFLLDVSGSMHSEDKLPLLRESFKLLIDNLNENDVVSIVTYAGSDSVVADSVRGDKHRKLKRLMDNLRAGGSTAGAQGLRTAYQLAEKNFIEDGNNRVILATDGDFNVGESSDEAMIELIETARDSGVFISVLGFGMGNLKDSKMEKIADHGNGNYAYIDTLAEARKVLVKEFESTLFTIAKDLKLQVEFNPATVAQYRLIGYNNRRLENEDFNDDEKDAGDIGAGHSVTAFYEIIPAWMDEDEPAVDDLIFQQPSGTLSDAYLYVKLRYKPPAEEQSILVTVPVDADSYRRKNSESFGFASAVAEFGLLLTDSQYQGNSSAYDVLARAKKYQGADPYGLRAEFASLVETYAYMTD